MSDRPAAEARPAAPQHDTLAHLEAGVLGPTLDGCPGCIARAEALAGSNSELYWARPRDWGKGTRTHSFTEVEELAHKAMHQSFDPAIKGMGNVILHLLDEIRLLRGEAPR